MGNVEFEVFGGPADSDDEDRFGRDEGDDSDLDGRE